MNKLYEKITIIIIVYGDSFESISKCLSCIKNFKIILIDNKKDLSLKKRIENKFKISKYVINNKNIGFSKGVNQAIRLCNTEFILNLEADCIITEGCISKLFEAFDKYDNCVISTPTMVNIEGQLTHSGGVLLEKNIKYEVLNLNGDTCVDFPMTAAILFKKKDMLDIGMFDEDLFIYYPDVEIGRRIKTFNKSIIQIYNARAIHSMGNLKIKNKIKREFFRNYFFTLDGLIYFYKSKFFFNHYITIKKKIPSLITKFFINLFTFRYIKSTKCLAQVLAYYKFKYSFYNKNRN